MTMLSGKLNFFSIKNLQMTPLINHEAITKYHFKEINPHTIIAVVDIGPPIKDIIKGKGFCPIGINPYPTP